MTVVDPPLPALPVEEIAPPVTSTTVRGDTALGRFWRGRPDDPAWVRPTLLALLVGTTVLYVWGLSASGWANSYYTAAVQAGTKSWKAFLFGSTDSGNFVTVDKTPASLWPSVIAARIFGLNSWSLLVPQALEGVATVGLVYLAVRRWFGGPAGLLAGFVTATTPAAALSFRYNNPDALLVLCMVAGAYCVTRAIEDGRMRWVVLTGAAVGVAFLAKELQAFLVLPGFALAYFLAAPARWTRRFVDLVVMGVSMLVAAGWFVAILVLTPASSPPTSAARRTTASGTCSSATTASAGSPATRPGASAAGDRAVPVAAVASGGRPASRACSTRRSVAARPGCCPPRWYSSSPRSP